MITLRDNFKTKKLAIFDLDGTIVDSHNYVLQAINQVLNKLELFPIDEMPEGVFMEDLWRSILLSRELPHKIKVSELAKQTYTAYMDIISTVPLEIKEGFWSMAFLFKQTLKIPMALCTNTNRQVVQKVLDNVGIKETFDFIICGDEVSHPKPNPEIYKKALAHFKIKPTEAIAFDDSVDGVRASITAGIETYVIWNGKVSRYSYPEGAEHFFENFTDIIGRLDLDFDKDLKEYAERLRPILGR